MQLHEALRMSQFVGVLIIVFVVCTTVFAIGVIVGIKIGCKNG